MWLLYVIKPNISLIVQHFGYENHLFLVCLFENHLIEIWLFDSTSMSQSAKSLSKMDKTSVSFIKESDLCLDIEATRKKLPSSFSRFTSCVYIIDCPEIFTERQQNQLDRAQLYSKSHNTVNYMIGITPAGAVSFLSYGCRRTWLRQDDNTKFRFFRNGLTW